MTCRCPKVLSLPLFLILLVACSTTPSRQLPSRNVAKEMAVRPLEEYRLCPGDTVEIKFFHHPELHETAIIRPDGKITLQFVDDVLAAGLTPSELDEMLTELYSKHLENIVISVMVRSFSEHKIYVSGEVQRPGLYPLTNDTTVLKSIAAAQGFKETAQPENIIIIRKGPKGEPVPVRVNLEPVLEGKQMERDIYLMPSDVVYVPKTFVAEANKFVDQYIRKLLMIDPLIAGIGWGVGWKIVD